jgi:hypothetical protein
MTANNAVSNDFSWGPVESRFYIDYMLEGIHNGQRPSGTFRNEFWVSCAAAFAAAGLRTPTLKQLSNKRVVWREKWCMWQVLLDQSGWGIDPNTGQFAVDDAQWDRAIEVHGDKYKWFRNNVLEYATDLDEIFRDVQAIGTFAQTAAVRPSDPALSETSESSSPSVGSRKRKPSPDASTDAILRYLVEEREEKRQRREERKAAQVDWEKEALETLQNDESFALMNEWEFIQAIDIVKNDAKTFITLQPRWRLQWLMNKVNCRPGI